jgi:NADPH-dependent curcumin reductase CurA
MTDSAINRQWRVAHYPKPDELIGKTHFEWTEEQIPEPDKGEFLVRAAFLAPGPAQRGYLDQRQSEFLGKPVAVGEVMRGRGIGEIIASSHPEYGVGEIFVGSLGWQDYSIQRPMGKGFVFSTRKIGAPRRPLSLHLGVLGQAGATAYFGLTEGANIQPGDNVLISAAAGGVGSVAGQIARIKGAANLIGIAGSADKCAWLCDELGFDAAINYKQGNLDDQLGELFPDGIDVYLDSVGGDTLNTALGHLAMHARVAIGGLISTQYADGPVAGPSNYKQLLYKRATMRGFVFFDYWDRYMEAESTLCEWFDSGELIDTECLTEGLINMPDALNGLFTGANKGIAICSA